ncbi:hypothetical protein DBR06_SOUSAS3810077, partial [Sousa chinensis]
PCLHAHHCRCADPW